MNNTLNHLLPIIILLLLNVFIVIVIIKISGNKNFNSSQTNRESRVLSKSESNRVIAGVCGGIAEYFGWNVIVVRLVFLFSGFGTLTYIVLSIVLPNPPSSLF